MERYERKVDRRYLREIEGGGEGDEGKIVKDLQGSRGKIRRKRKVEIGRYVKKRSIVKIEGN